MLTRKDFTLLAEYLDIKVRDTLTWGVDENKDPYEVYEALVLEMIDILKPTNPEFNVEKFKKACNI